MPTTLSGDKELLQTFGRLVGKEMGRAKRRAVQKGLFVIERQVKQNFRGLSDSIPRAIDTVVRAYNDDNFIMGFVGLGDQDDSTKRNPKAVRARGPAQTTDLSPLAQKALILEFGSDPHIIEASGQDPVLLANFDFRPPKFFGSKVSHPGTRPKAPMRRAFNQKRGEAQRILKRELAREIDRLATERQDAVLRKLLPGVF